MSLFEIKEKFYLNNKEFKILSGAIHYFRIHPSQWEDTLFNLKALGFNTVETYVPWNIHEPYEGKFNFEGFNDIESFLEIAKKLDLYVILRPSPYICAEWEFGGLPPWLLKDESIRIRSSESNFINKLENYYNNLLPRLLKYQITNNGPILMMQVENEYGSYGNDKKYLKSILEIMKKNGVDVPLFTSDGTWIEALDSGSLIEENIFVTGNFGSKSLENCKVLKEFIEENNKSWPIMCMEYWDGWFNRWGEPIIKRDALDFINDVKEMINLGSVNLYMFRGGTNFGFMNGCSARGDKDLPQITSYDYDAIVTEWGGLTDKYYKLKSLIKSMYPSIEQLNPRECSLKNLGVFSIDGSVSLFSIIDDISCENKSLYPQNMEKLDCNYGYILYSTHINNYNHDEKLNIIEASDRCQIYIDKKFACSQYREEIGTEIIFNSKQEKIDIDILVENLGRVNYGYKLNSPTQRKGIRRGVLINNHFHSGWSQYPLCLDSEMVSKIEFSDNIELEVNTPMFYHATVNLESISNTFIDCSNYGKGCIFINGFNIGRYWNKGPVQYLYVPSGLLKEKNDIVIFETENIIINKIIFSDKPIFLKSN